MNDFLTTVLVKCGSIIKLGRCGLTTVVENGKLIVRATSGRSKYLSFKIEADLDNEFSCNDALEELNTLELLVQEDIEADLLTSITGLIHLQSDETLQFLITEEGQKKLQQAATAVLAARNNILAQI